MTTTDYDRAMNIVYARCAAARRREMDDVKHTPGPWRLHQVERATIVAGNPGGEVANCLNGFGDQDANARFIASAPAEIVRLKAVNAELVAALELISGAIYERRGDVVVAEPDSILAELVTAIANAANSALAKAGAA